jgi:hypothetical protein
LRERLRCRIIVIFNDIVRVSVEQRRMPRRWEFRRRNGPDVTAADPASRMPAARWSLPGALQGGRATAGLVSPHSVVMIRPNSRLAAMEPVEAGRDLDVTGAKAPHARSGGRRPIVPCVIRGTGSAAISVNLASEEDTARGRRLPGAGVFSVEGRPTLQIDRSASATWREKPPRC